jgi:hypothetical protein
MFRGLITLVLQNVLYDEDDVVDEHGVHIAHHNLHNIVV